MTRQIIYTRPYRSLPVRIFRGFLLLLFLGVVLESLILSTIFFAKAMSERAHYRAQHHLK